MTNWKVRMTDDKFNLKFVIVESETIQQAFIDAEKQHEGCTAHSASFHSTNLDKYPYHEAIQS